MANVMCEYASSASPEEDEGEYSQNWKHRHLMTRHPMLVGSGSTNKYLTEPGRRIRRSEYILRQAAEIVSRGQTFQTVSDMFNIPISTIR